MTRKHFQAVATMVGEMGRQMGDGTWHDTLKVAVQHMSEQNPNFKESVFIDWANEVRNSMEGV